jgi:hypothetical protein
MPRDALRFDGEVLNTDGTSLGEARFWGSAERETGAAPWRGWLRLADLGRAELPAGRYRVRSFEGWEAEFEPIITKPERILEFELVPVRGIGDAPWTETPGGASSSNYQPLWPETPPRTAHDRTRFPPDLRPLEAVPQEGVLPPGLDWPPVPDGR